MSSVPYRLAGLACFLCACICAVAQQTSQPGAPASPAAVPLEPVPRVPGLTSFWRGFNAGVTFSGVHDSSIGWYTVATPAVSYAFSPHYSVDATATIYPSRLVPVQSTGRSRTEHLDMDTGDVGDTAISFHAGFNPRGFRNVTTAAFTIPTGNQQEGLGAGQATYDFSNRFEGYHKQAGFLVDFGAGNSSGLFNRLLTNDYTSVGGLVHVLAGGNFWLFGSNSIQSVFYEQYPVGSQTVYAEPRIVGGSVQSVVLRGSEDNGVTTSVGIPLSDHLILSGYYSRSFQFNLDTASVGMTYVLRSIHRAKHLSMIDRALREAESSIDDSGDQPSTTPRIY